MELVAGCPDAPRRHSHSPTATGIPTASALAELDGVGAQVWQTDRHGKITVNFTGQGPVVASER